MFVKEQMPHIIALRVNCVALEHTGLVPDLEICALLHEEAWYVDLMPASHFPWVTNDADNLLQLIRLHMMQTTIDYMYLTCFYDGLPLAS